MKPWAVALLVFVLGAGVTAVILVMWTPPAWRIIAGVAGLLIASKLAAVFAAVFAAAWRERGN